MAIAGITLTGADERTPLDTRQARTHCLRGHLFTSESTIVIKKTGKRRCRICLNARAKRKGREYRAANPLPPSADLTGQVIKGWLVLSKSSIIKSKCICWNVRCVQCGRERITPGSKLMTNRNTKCDHSETRTAGKLLLPHFAPIPSLPGYIAGDDGSIWSCLSPITKGGVSTEWVKMKVCLDKAGYPVFGARVCGKIVTRKVSRCVLEAFVGPCPEGMECCHAPDNDPKNSRLENLRWDTRESNIADMMAIGSQAKGETHGMCRLTTEQVLEVRRLREQEHLSHAKIGRILGISKSHVGQIVNRKNWKHV